MMTRAVLFFVFASSVVYASTPASDFDAGLLSAVEYIRAEIAEAKTPSVRPLSLAQSYRDMPESATWVPLAVFSGLQGENTTAYETLLPVLYRPTVPGEDTLTGGIGHSYSVPAVYHDSPGGRFRVWYVETTRDAPDMTDTSGITGVPDYVERTASACDHVEHVLIDSLNYRAPVSDTMVAYPPGWPNGGDGRFDVYLLDLPEGYLGYTVPEQVYGDRQATCYLVLDNDYEGYSLGPDTLLATTTAHELFHAAQFAYDVFETGYVNGLSAPVWMEMSAVWAEDQVYPEYDQYVSYLPIFFDNPWIGLFAFSNDRDSPHGLHQYAACVFSFFLEARFGAGTVRTVWEHCADVRGDNLISAIDATIAPHASFVSALSEFVEYNVFTGTRADSTRFYHEAHLWPELDVDSAQMHASFPVSVPNASDPPEGFGCGYAVFVPDGSTGGLRVAFSGSNLSPWGTEVVGVPSAGAEPYRLSQTGEGPSLFEVRNWDGFSHVYLAALSLAIVPSRYVYGYSASYDPALVGLATLSSGDAVLDPYPNPYIETEAIGGLSFPFRLSADGAARVDVFTLTGSRVWHWESQETLAGRTAPYVVVWDTANEEGEKVASGMYIAYVQAGGATRAVKVAVVR